MGGAWAVRDERGRPAELYRLYDAAGRLLYIGVSSTVERRLRTHSYRGQNAWWGQVDHCSLEWFAEGHQALAAEVLAIRSERPVYNKRSAVVA